MNNYNYTAYDSTRLVRKYEEAIGIGLWESEKYVIQKYINVDCRILDVACGAGRTTLGIRKLGYSRITGIDFSEKMISVAKNKCKDINFICCDMCKLPFETNTFDAVFVSYNALMMVPCYENRLKILYEFNRVLTNNGILIFTASDREYNPCFRQFWNEEKEKWKNKLQDKKLYEYGDQLFTECGETVFIHFATVDEVKKMLEQSGFILIENFFRSIMQESETVKLSSGDTMFYVSTKK